MLERQAPIADGEAAEILVRAGAGARTAGAVVGGGTGVGGGSAVAAEQVTTRSLWCMTNSSFFLCVVVIMSGWPVQENLLLMRFRPLRLVKVGLTLATTTPAIPDNLSALRRGSVIERATCVSRRREDTRSSWERSGPDDRSQAPPCRGRSTLGSSGQPSGVDCQGIRHGWNTATPPTK